jgi:hypothetical protein
MLELLHLLNSLQKNIEFAICIPKFYKFVTIKIKNYEKNSVYFFGLGCPCISFLF